MSRQQFFSKYSAEKALSMLGENSDNSESDDESSDVDVDEADLEEIRSTLFDQEMPSPEDSSSDEDNELDDFSSTRETEKYGLRCYLTEQSERVFQILFE